MKRLALIPVIVVSVLMTCLNAFETVDYNSGNGILQNNHVYDVFFYDTNTDPLSTSWKNDTSKSWYQEPSNPSDDFTGTLDANRWIQAGDPTISNNIYFQAIGMGVLQQVSSNTRWTLSGNFDIRIAFSAFTSTDNGELQLRVSDDAGHFSYVSISKISGSLYYKKKVYPSSSWQLATTDTQGMIRLVRTGTSVSAYYASWNPGASTIADTWQWIEIGSGNTFDYNSLTVAACISGEGALSSSIDAVADNFQYVDNGGTTSFGCLGGKERSAARAFPDQAIIVAHDMGIDIIDAATDQMWMRFKAYDDVLITDVKYQNMIADKVMSLSALNGRIYCGANSGNMQGLGVIDLVNDKAYFYDGHTGAGQGWDCLSNISQRNMHLGWNDNTAHYVKLNSSKVNDLAVRYANDKTFIALANDLDPTTGKGLLTVVNQTMNTLAIDYTVASRKVTNVVFGNNGYLYYCELNNLFKSQTAWMTAGVFNPDNSSVISLSDSEDPADLAVSNSFIYVADKSITSPYEMGSTVKHRLDTVGSTGVFYRWGGFPTVALWGSGSCSALACNSKAIWVATGNAAQGRIYIIGAMDPNTDQLLGEFNKPWPLPPGDITCLEYGSTTAYPENLFAGFSDCGVTRIKGLVNELSMYQPEEGMVQHNFINGNPFTFKYAGCNVTIDPPTTSTYGNFLFQYHDGDPVCSHPEHVWDKWWSFTTSSGYEPYPCSISLNFTSPVPDGNQSLWLWKYDPINQYWLTQDEELDFGVTTWSFNSSPYNMGYFTYAPGTWAMNDGDGGMLSFPPTQPQNLLFDLYGGYVHLSWDPISFDTGGYALDDFEYRVMSGLSPNTGLVDVTDQGILEGTHWSCSTPSRRQFYYIKAVRHETAVRQ